MQYHFRHTIINVETKEVIDEVYKRANIDRTLSGNDLEYTHASDEFLALLGTPNGRATPFMLTDHPVAHGKKM